MIIIAIFLAIFLAIFFCYVLWTCFHNIDSDFCRYDNYIIENYQEEKQTNTNLQNEDINMSNCKSAIMFMFL